MAKHNEDASRNGGPVGSNILRLRRQQRLTQKQLAEPEFSISYISAIERGRIRPSLKALDILARRLGVSSAELLAELPDYVEPQANEIDAEAAQALSLPALLGQRHPPFLAPLALCWASVCLVQHHYQLANELLNLIAPGTITPEQHLLIIYFRGVIALEEGRPAEAETLLENVFQQEEFRPHAEMLARCRLVLARAYEAQGKFLPAADAFTLCAQGIEKGIVTEPLFAIHVYASLADHYRHLKRRDIAVSYYRQALKQFEFVLDPIALAEASARLSRQHLENIHSTLVDWYAARSRSLLEFAGMRQRFAQTATNLGLTLQELGDSQAAEAQLREAIDVSEQLGANRQGILTRLDLADMLLERQDAPEAERLALEAQKLCHFNTPTRSEDEILYGRVLVTLADANKALNRLDEADKCFQEAIALLEKHQANDYLSQAYFRYSALLDQRGQHAEGYKLMTQAYLLSKQNSEAGG